MIKIRLCIYLKINIIEIIPKIIETQLVLLILFLFFFFFTISPFLLRIYAFQTKCKSNCIQNSLILFLVVQVINWTSARYDRPFISSGFILSELSNYFNRFSCWCHQVGNQCRMSKQATWKLCLPQFVYSFYSLWWYRAGQC